jgi:hypothetical protein
MIRRTSPPAPDGSCRRGAAERARAPRGGRRRRRAAARAAAAAAAAATSRQFTEEGV